MAEMENDMGDDKKQKEAEPKKEDLLNLADRSSRNTGDGRVTIHHKPSPPYHPHKEDD